MDNVSHIDFQQEAFTIVQTLLHDAEAIGPTGCCDTANYLWQGSGAIFEIPLGPTDDGPMSRFTLVSYGRLDRKRKGDYAKIHFAKAPQSRRCSL